MVCFVLSQDGAFVELDCGGVKSWAQLPTRCEAGPAEAGDRRQMAAGKRAQSFPQVRFTKAHCQRERGEALAEAPKSCNGP